jgi:hypothetical protein
MNWPPRWRSLAVGHLVSLRLSSVVVAVVVSQPALSAEAVED